MIKPCIEVLEHFSVHFFVCRCQWMEVCKMHFNCVQELDH